MKITIDTKEDSHDEIRKVVTMLQAWINGHSNSMYDTPASTPTENAGGLMDMFNTPITPSQPSEPSPSSEPVETAAPAGIFNIFNDDTTPTNEPEPIPEDDKSDEEEQEIEYSDHVDLMTYE